MQSGNRDSHGRNEMWTPPNISVTDALISNALKQISLNNNGDDLFDIVDIEGGQAIAPNEDLPLQASNFKITSADEQITADETNACSVKVVRDFINDIDTRLLENYMTETECDSKYLTKNGWIAGHYDDPATEGYSKTEVDSALSNKANSSDVYTKAQVDSALSTKANSADVYTKAQVDEAIAAIDTGVTEEELNAKLEAYATKDWVEAAISSGGDVGPMVASQTGSYESMTQYSYVDFTATPTTSSPMHLFDSFARNHYNEGYRSSYYLQSAKFSIKGYNSETGQYDQYIDWDHVMKELECRMVVYKSIHYYDEEEEEEEYEEITEDLGLMVLFCDREADKYYAKGICQTVDDPESYYIHLQFARKSTATHIPDKLEIKWVFDSETSMIENPFVRVIKENNNDGFVTEKKLDEVQTNIANTYLTKSNAQTTYATKTYVDDSIANIPDQGLVTLNVPIETQSLSVTIADGATDAHTTNPLIEIPADDSKTKNIKVTLNCTITSNSTDISHNLDDYTFQLKDQTGHLCCTLNSIYESENSTDYTSLQGQFSGTFTSSNNRISLYITRVASTPAESIVMTATDTNIGTASLVIGGYITKAYADEHYASKDTPTVMNITNYDDSTHTTNKTTYDFGPDFSININGELAFKVTLKVGGSPAVQMATAAITTALQFGLEQISSNNDAYTSDIYNAIGLNQSSALTNYSNWVSNYSRYDDNDITLDNFVITAALAEQRYLKSADLSNYYTKTETDNAISTAISQIPTAPASLLQWTAGAYTMKFMPETVESQGDVNTSLNLKVGNSTLARIATSPTAMPTLSSIHAHSIKPVNGIEFGKNLDNTAQLTQWSGTITNIANDNYDSTTYSSADLDTIVPSLKFLNAQNYTKIQVDSAITSHIGALDAKFVSQESSNPLRKITWDSMQLTLYTRNAPTDNWTPKISIIPSSVTGTSQITVGRIYLNSECSTSGDCIQSILTSSSSKSSVDSALTTGGYINQYYAAKNGSVKSLYWTGTIEGENYEFKVEPDGTSGNEQNLRFLKKGENDQYFTYASNFKFSNGSFFSGYVCPATALVFGKMRDGSDNSNRWNAAIEEIATSAYIANRNTLPYSNFTNRDALLPTLKVLEDNYYTKTEVDAKIPSVARTRFTDSSSGTKMTQTISAQTYYAELFYRNTPTELKTGNWNAMFIFRWSDNDTTIDWNLLCPAFTVDANREIVYTDSNNVEHTTGGGYFTTSPCMREYRNSGSFKCCRSVMQGIIFQPTIPDGSTLVSDRIVVRYTNCSTVSCGTWGEVSSTVSGVPM